MNSFSSILIPCCLCLILAIFSSGLNAQEGFYEEPTPVMHEKRDWTISLSPNYVNHPNGYPRVVGGLNSMVFLGKHFSLNASIAAGQGYFHFGTGLLGVPAIIIAGADVLFADLSTEAMLMWAVLLSLWQKGLRFGYLGQKEVPELRIHFCFQFSLKVVQVAIINFHGSGP